MYNAQDFDDFDEHAILMDFMSIAANAWVRVAWELNSENTNMNREHINYNKMNTLWLH